jgi:hypothetical protein
VQGCFTRPGRLLAATPPTGRTITSSAGGPHAQAEVVLAFAAAAMRLADPVLHGLVMAAAPPSRPATAAGHGGRGASGSGLAPQRFPAHMVSLRGQRAPPSPSRPGSPSPGFPSAGAGAWSRPGTAAGKEAVEAAVPSAGGAASAGPELLWFRAGFTSKVI